MGTAIFFVILGFIFLYAFASTARRRADVAIRRTEAQAELLQELQNRVQALEEGTQGGSRARKSPGAAALQAVPASTAANPPLPGASERLTPLPQVPAAHVPGQDLLQPSKSQTRGDTPRKAAAGPTFVERLRKRWADEEWETMIGSNWLNALGVLTLVVGVALFLGFSLTRLGPPGRVLVGYASGICLLAGGLIAERNRRYLLFARGLIAGGWAALYFTSFAAWALDAARVIDSERVGIALLLVVAAGMILHALRYRQQFVAALAFVIGFVTLVLAPEANLALIASVPLMAVLLVVAYLRLWQRLALLGLFATYGIYLLGVIRNPLLPLPAAVAVVGALWVYWAAIEFYHLAQTLAGRDLEPESQSILVLNTAGLLGGLILNEAYQPSAVPERALALAGGAFLLSALLRARLRPPASVPRKLSPVQGRLSGAFEGPLTVAAAAFAVDALRGLSGWWIPTAWLLEGELLFLVGQSLGYRYVRQLGAALLAFAIALTLASNLWRSDLLQVAAIPVTSGTPLAVALAALLYVNRWLTRAENRLAWHEPWFTGAASALMALALANNLPNAWVGAAWAAGGLVMLEVSLRTGLPDLRWHAAAAGSLGGVAVLAAHSWAGRGAGPGPLSWPLLATATAGAAGCARTFFRLSDRWPIHGLRWMRNGAAAMAVIIGAVTLWSLLQPSLVALAWSIGAMVLVLLGTRLSWQGASGLAHLLVLAAFLRLPIGNFTALGNTGGVSHRILTIIPMILVAWQFWRFALAAPLGLAERWRPAVSRLYFHLGTLLAVLLMRFELGRVLTVLGWAALGIVLLMLARRTADRHWRWQAQLVFVLCFLRAWSVHVYAPETLLGLAGRVGSVSAVVASLFAASFLLANPPRDARATQANSIVRLLRALDYHAKSLAMILAAMLLAALLQQELPGGWLTVGLALEAATLLGAGIALGLRVTRLSGLALFGICLLKLFLWDLREMETPYRILSFILSGLLLIGVSWLYTRFGRQVRRYL